MKKTRVFHVDGDPLAADFIGRMIKRWPEVRYLGHAATGGDGQKSCVGHMPDILLVDMMLPDMDGFELVTKIQQAHQAIRVIIVTVRDDPGVLYKVMSGGVAGIVWKSLEMATDLRDAIIRVAHGESFIPREIADTFRKFRQNPTAFTKLLSVREIELLGMFGSALGNQQVAARTGLTPNTVQLHRQRIMRKLDVHNEASLVCWAVRHGIGYIPRMGRSNY